MANSYKLNLYAQDYRYLPKSKPEAHLIWNRNHRNSSSYSLSQDHSEYENKNEKNQNAFSSYNTPDILQNQSKESLFLSNSKLEIIGIQHFEGDNPVHLMQDNNPKDKRNLQNTTVGDGNFKFRPNRKCLRSRSAPSILSLASKQNGSGKRTDANQWPESDMKNEKVSIAKPEITIEKFRPSSKKRSQDMKSNQRNRYVNVRKRRESRRRLKIPTKKLHFTENGKMDFSKKGLLDLVNRMKNAPGSRISDETDRCSSYSESNNLKHIAKRKNRRNERATPELNSQQILMQNIPRSSLNEKMKYISNALRFPNCESLYKESQNENYSKKTDSRFTTDSFLRQELSDFREFLIYRRNQKQRTNLQPKQRLPTVCIPESCKLQKMVVCENRNAKNDYKNKKENANGNQPPSPTNLKTRQTRQTHTTRKPKVSEEVLWNHFKRNFKSHASTKRYSGEVIPRKISTAWMSEMGVVGEILSEEDADNEFKKAAGSKITMNLEEYKAFLIRLTMKKKLPFYEIYRRMCGI